MPRDLAESRSHGGAQRILTHLGEAYGLAGRMEEATVALQRALALARQRKMRGNAAWALYTLGNVYRFAELSDAVAARQSYSHALSSPRSWRCGRSKHNVFLRSAS